MEVLSVDQERDASNPVISVNYDGTEYTFQLDSDGVELLESIGVSEGDEVPSGIARVLDDLALLEPMHDGSPFLMLQVTDNDTLGFECLTVEKLARFALEVLNEVQLSQVASQPFLKLLVCLCGEERRYVEPVVEELVTNTPYTGEMVWDITSKRGHSTIAFACLLHYWFELLREKDNAQTYVEYFRGHLIHSTDEYDWLIINEDTVNEDIDTSELQFTAPSPIEEKLGINEPGRHSELETAVSELEGESLVDELGLPGSVIVAGVSSVSAAGLAVVPAT